MEEINRSWIMCFMNIQRVSWNNYRQKLLPIIKKIEQRNNHLFSDEIDKALSEGRAFLFIGGDGFFVLEPISQNEETIANVMFAFNWGGDAVKRYQVVIEQLAHDIGAVKLELYTKVKELAPLLKSQGWQKVESGPVMHWVKRL
ncbi:hypothetical protein [Photobacterium damselae]|uniref:hypothetical protein n=1 Tax=Photobacterium damselae TaxID=38293 RepID=UPI001F2FDFA0|nr:hypothetical protein [Photobacterium damselae]UKA12672.1 hypothetical protein IHC91_17345 [Photobacterium damselae subsp. damselae]